MQLTIAAAVALAASASLSAQQLPAGTLESFRWRSIGPANMGGRIVDIAGIPSPSHTFYVSAAGGGLFKTTNAGTTFTPLLDTIPVSSGGMIGIAPSDTNVVYYGTGEPNMRNSVSPGAGVWKTADGGHTWMFLGLAKTQHIGRVVVDPRNADVAYVAAVGAAWSPSAERGLYKTVDGGHTWQRVLYVSDSAGVIDVALNPANPNEVWAASYEFLRTPYYVKSGGRGSALWKSEDAGVSWQKIEGNGFPSTLKGRIGIALSASGRVVYAIVEGAKLRNAPEDTLYNGAPNPVSGLYRSGDAGAHWAKVNVRNERPFYFSQVRVSPADSNRVYWLGVQPYASRDGGHTAALAMRTLHGDHHALWIDPTDPRHLIDGNDGGLAQSWDDGKSWDLLNTLAIGQFYSVSYNMDVPYRVCGGLQDNGTWCGPSRRKVGAITNADWVQVYFGDGGVTAQSAADPDLIVSEGQGGGIGWQSFAKGEDNRTKAQLQLQRARGRGEYPTDAASASRFPYRSNWITPFVLSAHEPHALYVGQNHVIKVHDVRVDGGCSSNCSSRDTATSNFAIISPDLTTDDTLKMRLGRTFRIANDTLDHTESESYCTISALAESPMRPGFLFAGTDDGNVWRTRDDGVYWENLTGRFPGAPANTFVSRIEPSHFDVNVFYVAFDNHARNDFRPYVYRTTDGGKTFTPIVNGLSKTGRDYVYVVREHPQNRNLLFAGTESGVFVSLDAGAHWSPFGAGLPAVGVRDLAIQPREGELIAATHGRSVWIVDVSPLEQIGHAVLASDAYLFRPHVATQFEEPYRAGLMALPLGNGNRVFATATPTDGFDFSFWLGRDVDRVRLIVRNVRGDTVIKNWLSGRRGLNRLAWVGYTKRMTRPPRTRAQRSDSVARARKIVAFLDTANRGGKIDAETFGRIRHEVLAGENLYTLAWELRGGMPTYEASEPQPLSPAWPGEEEIRPPAPAPAWTPWATGLSGPVARLFEALRAFGAGNYAAYRPGLAAPGTYTVTLVVGDREMSQRLHIERR